MSVNTENDERLEKAREAVQDLVTYLGDIVKDSNFVSEYSLEFKGKLLDAFSKSVQIRNELA